MMLLTIDPGADCGWALFDLGAKTLWECGLRTMPATWPAPITRIVSEKPHTGDTGARKADVITLAIRAGEVAGIWSYLTGVVPEYITPNRWKGSQPKSVSHGIIRRRLSTQEWQLYERNCQKLSQSLRHNVLDAIGIGLYILRRY